MKTASLLQDYCGHLTDSSYLHTSDSSTRFTQEHNNNHGQGFNLELSALVPTSTHQHVSHQLDIYGFKIWLFKTPF